MSGCTSIPSHGVPLVPTPAHTTIATPEHETRAGTNQSPSLPATTMVPSPPSPTATTARPTTTPTFASIQAVNKHFLTIAFSEGNGVIQRQENRKSGGISIAIWGGFTRKDKALIESFANDFNRISRTTRLNPFVKEGIDADMWVNFFPESTLPSIPHEIIDYTAYEPGTGRVLFFVNISEQVFVNADLMQPRRDHTTLRALLYWLGITGEATDPESFFYPGNLDQVILTDPDWKALTILYGPVVKNNMTVAETKNRMYTV